MRIDESNFNFVTGDKNQIYEIAKSYFVNVSEDELAPGGFLHSEYLVIIDKEGRVRSGYSNFMCSTCQTTYKKYSLTCPSTGEKNTMRGNAVGSYDGTKDFVIKDMIKEGIISDGMIPKTETALYALDGGVRAVVILDGRVQNACLLELFTEHGAGSLIRN